MRFSILNVTYSGGEKEYSIKLFYLIPTYLKEEQANTVECGQ